MIKQSVLKFKVKDKGPILGLKASYEGVKTTRNYNMSHYAPLSGGSVHTPGVMFGQVVCPNILKCQSLARYACEIHDIFNCQFILKISTSPPIHLNKSSRVQHLYKRGI